VIRTTMTKLTAALTAIWTLAGAGAGQAAETATAAVTAPAAKSDPAPVSDGDTTVGALQGMQILVKRVPGADFVAANLYVKGGARNWTTDNAGVEALALLTAAGGGTEALAKEAFGRRLAHLGSELSAETREDYSVLRLKSLKASWDDSFPLLTDVFLHPALPASEIELQRQRELSMLKHEEDVPDLRLHVLLHQLLYQNHPYQNRAIGTQLTMGKLDAAQLRAHLAKLRETGRLLLVVVGDVDPEHVLAQVKQAFGGLPRGGYRDQPLAAPALAGSRFNAVERKLPTNYIQGAFAGPGWRDPEFAAALVAMRALQFREFVEVRTKRNLSYAPNAGFGTAGAIPWGNLYVTAVDPTTTWRVMLDEAGKLAREPLPAEELAGNKSVFLSNFLMSSETTDGLANLVGNMQLYAGDWRGVRTLPERIRAVSAADVQAFAKKYMHKLQTVYLGDPSKVDKKLFDSM
jgi:zinc protease